MFKEDPEEPDLKKQKLNNDVIDEPNFKHCWKGVILLHNQYVIKYYNPDNNEYNNEDLFHGYDLTCEYCETLYKFDKNIKPSSGYCEKRILEFFQQDLN